MSNHFQSPKLSGRVRCLGRKPLFYHKKANPKEFGKKREQHTTHTPLQANRWARQHTKPKHHTILYNTSIFQALDECNQSQALKQWKASAPSPGCSKTHSSFVTQIASSSHVLGKLYCTKVKCNFSPRLYYSPDSAASATCTFTAAL